MRTILHATGVRGGPHFLTWTSVVYLVIALTTGCGGDGPDIAPQTLKRARELVERYERARKEFLESDLPGQAARPNTAWLEEALNLLDSPAGQRIERGERLGIQIQAWMLKEDWDLAAEAIESLLKTSDRDARLWRDLALCRLKMGPAGWPGAETAARKSLELEDHSAEGWWLAGKVAQVQEQGDKARECFAKALERDSGFLPARLEQAVDAVANGDFAAAASVLREAGKKARPYDVMLRLEFRQALVEAEKAGQKFPSNPDQYAAAARVYYQAARFEDAIQWARKALEAVPDDFDTVGLLTLTLTQLGRLNEARDACQQFLDIHPEHEGAKALLNQLNQADKEFDASPAPGVPGAPESPRS